MRPRRWSHRGVVLAHGFALGAGVVSEAEIARRLLALWAPGVQLYRTGRFWIAILAEPVLVACDRAIGEPLVRVASLDSSVVFGVASSLGPPGRASLLSAVPLAPDQAGQLAGAALVLADAGRLEAIGQDQLEPVDPSAWLDADWECLPGSPLGDPPAAPRPITPAALDPHAALGVAPAAPEREAVLAELARRERDRSGAPAATRPGLLGRLRAWWRSTAHARGGASRWPASGPGRPGTGAWTRLRRWLSVTLARSRLGLALGRRQARYLAELQELFARGELDEALRRALPTTTRVGGGDRLAFGLPGERSSLELRLRRPEGRAGVMLVGGNWFDTLRETYARTARQLAAQGRIAEAAFVLLELLDDPEDCVRLLEEHGRVRKAAEIAEARDLAPGLVVRLWFLAGEHQRAVAAARRTGAFADAVARLDRTHPREAAALRLLWADSAADAGDYNAAVSIAWQVDEARRLVDVWMDRAIAAGGVAGAGMLGRLLARHPDRLSWVAARLGDLAEPTRREERLALAAGLVQNPGDAARVVARPLLRALLRDAAERPEQRVRDALARVSRFEGGLVRADMPALTGAEANADAARSEASPLVLALEAIDAGPLDICQAVPLPDRRVLLALGELGAALIDRHGVMVHRFAPPCEELVVADSGLRALGLCRRGTTTVVHKLDLETRRSAPGGELADRTSIARSYDGSIWFAASDDDLWGFDVHAERMTAVWHVGGVRPTYVRRAPDRLLVVMSCDHEEQRGLELWQYELPGLALRQRQRWAPSSDGATFVDAAADGRWVELATDEPARTLLVSANGRRSVEIPVGMPDLHARGVAVAFLNDGAMAVHLVDNDGVERATLQLRGSSVANFGWSRHALACADDRGRVVVIAADGSEVLANLRPELPGSRAASRR